MPNIVLQPTGIINILLFRWNPVIVLFMGIKLRDLFINRFFYCRSQSNNEREKSKLRFSATSTVTWSRLSSFNTKGNKVRRKVVENK